MLLYEKYTDISEEIMNKLRYGKSVVGMDSMIFKEDFSYEEKIKYVTALADKVKEEDGILGMMAIINGRIKIGLTEEEVEFLAKLEKEIAVIERKDIPYYVSKRQSGIVSFDAALLLGNLTGIKVFITDFIGCEESIAGKREYIYRELHEIAKKNIVIISSGAKNTEELNIVVKCMEEYSIPMVGYQIDDVPLNIQGKDQKAVDYRFNTPFEIIEFLKVKWELGINGGVIILNSFQDKAAKMERITYNARFGSALGEEIYKIR